MILNNCKNCKKMSWEKKICDICAKIEIDNRTNPVIKCEKCKKDTVSSCIKFYISPEKRFIGDMDGGVGRDSIGAGTGYPCNHCNWWNRAYYKLK